MKTKINGRFEKFFNQAVNFIKKMRKIFFKNNENFEEEYFKLINVNMILKKLEDLEKIKIILLNKNQIYHTDNLSLNKTLIKKSSFEESKTSNGSIYIKKRRNLEKISSNSKHYSKNIIFFNKKLKSFF